jgi:hypothetical protein
MIIMIHVLFHELFLQNIQNVFFMSSIFVLQVYLLALHF